MRTLWQHLLYKVLFIMSRIQFSQVVTFGASEQMGIGSNAVQACGPPVHCNSKYVTDFNCILGSDIVVCCMLGSEKCTAFIVMVEGVLIWLLCLTGW
jgi:hypothetical protein